MPKQRNPWNWRGPVKKKAPEPSVASTPEPEPDQEPVKKKAGRPKKKADDE